MTADQVTAITGAVDYATVIGGIGTVAAAVIGVIVALKGASFLYRTLSGR